MDLKRQCPKDGAAMIVTQNEAMGIAFTCPVCGIERTHDQFRPEDKPEEGRINDSKIDGLFGEDQGRRAQG